MGYLIAAWIVKSAKEVAANLAHPEHLLNCSVPAVSKLCLHQRRLNTCSSSVRCVHF